MEVFFFFFFNKVIASLYRMSVPTASVVVGLHH